MQPTLSSKRTVQVPPSAALPGIRESLVLAGRHLRSGSRNAVVAIRNPRTWTRRWTAFGVLAVLYVVLSLLILIPDTPVLHLDTWLVDRHMWHKHPGWYPYVAFVVGFGQRWIMTYSLQFLFVWAALRSRSMRPIILFATALITLNCSVGMGKYLFGRVGPIHGDGAHTIFHLGANIFPSGHVSNTVVLYGVLAWALPQFRKVLATFAVVIAICVGIGTIYLRTHWFSDVMGGWIAGAMVLLALPSVLPYATRFCDLMVAGLRRVVYRRPVLHRRLHRILSWCYRVVPADPWFVEREARKRAEMEQKYPVARGERVAAAGVS